MIKKIVLSSLSLIIFSCNNKPNQEVVEINQPIVDIPEAVVDPNKTTEKPNYIFVAIVTEEPTNVHRNSTEESETIDWTNRYYCTKVEESYGELTSEMKMRILDSQEDDLRQTHLNSLNATFSALSNKATIQILYREVLVFKSYEEASLTRQKVIKGDYEFTERIN